MLKTTYKRVELAPLPAGWTEHKAPSGHTYYYNAETKKSTYTRPIVEPDELRIDYGAIIPDHEVQAGIKALNEFHKTTDRHQRGQGHFTGGRSYQDHTKHDKRRDKYQDRPKSKKAITNCTPWVLVTTKFKRRFVHNTETQESFWKFPSDVMMAVIEMEKGEWQAQKEDQQAKEHIEDGGQTVPPDATVDDNGVGRNEDDGSDSYEEVEVTDEEEDYETSKRLRLDDGTSIPQRPLEMDEDDIAYQLAQMEEDDYATDADEGFDDGDRYPNEDDVGLELTDEDSIALFRSLLDDFHIGPYSTFEALIENPNAPTLRDDRWVALPNMSSRRQAFTNWSRDRITELQARQAQEAATQKQRDPRAEYLAFLAEHASLKLYWPEFKRKFKKEPEMKDLNVADKDKEKLYRDFVAKLKLSDTDRKKEFVAALKSAKMDRAGSRAVAREHLLSVLEKDPRYYLLRSVRERDELVDAHVSTLS